MTPDNERLPLLPSAERRDFPVRDKHTVLQEVDENGDVIFRFKLDTSAASSPSLGEFYREAIHDLLRVVRLYSRGQPVIVDAFAFLNETRTQIPILPDDAIPRKDGALDASPSQ